MTISVFIEKLQNRLKFKLVKYIRNTPLYPFIYRSYWHFLFTSRKFKSGGFSYYTAQPNKGAGIGHQMANWIAGYWFAREFELKFAHIPFSNEKWESFLDFGKDEILMTDLLKKGYKKVRLPLFDEFNEAEVALNKKIIASYSNRNVIFIAEQDQFYRDQFGVMEAIKEKFHNASARKNDKLIYNKKSFNIAIHVRRGDIVIGQKNQNPNLLPRWQGNDYFEKVLSQVIKNVKTDKPIAIYLFSQGEKKDFPEFEKFENLHFCLDMNAQHSFTHGKCRFVDY